MQRILKLAASVAMLVLSVCGEEGSAPVNARGSFPMTVQNCITW